MASWQDLNAGQKAAAMHDSGPAAVYAGPGSGKTRVVALRAARLTEQGARILVTTFTNDATEEMRARIKPMVPRSCLGEATISTMHALCLKILKEKGLNRKLLTDEGQRKGLAEAALAMELEDGVAGFLTRSSYLKNIGETAKTYKPDNSYEDKEFSRVWKAFEKQKKDRGVMEFDDLLVEVVNLFRHEPAVLADWSSRFTHIMVDESQDMNRPQYIIALALGKQSHNVMLVGDPDQSLYAFRGADTLTFRQFASYAATRVYELRENYRSTRAVIAFSDSLIRQEEGRHPMFFVPTREDGAPVRWNVYADAETEALAVGDEILRLVEGGASFRDISVLFRVNAQAEAFERNFAALEIPYITSKSGDFYSRKEVAGILAYLEFFESYADEWLLGFLNLPSRKLSYSVGADMRRIAQFRNKSIWEILPDFTAPDLKSHKAVRTMLNDLLDIKERLNGIRSAGEAVRLIRQTMGFDSWLKISEMNDRDNDRIQNLEQMQDAAAHYPTIKAYLEAIHKVREDAERRKQEAKKKRKETDSVTVCTGHSAKGLEWKVVFAVGWSEQLLPHRKAEIIDEERRIAYVIATRAKDYLSISSLQNWNNATVEPSRFLKGINIKPAEHQEAPPPILSEEVVEEATLGGLFI